MTHFPTLSAAGTRHLICLFVACGGLVLSASAQRTVADQSGIHPDRYDYLTEDDLKLHEGAFYETAVVPAESRAYTPAAASPLERRVAANEAYPPFVSQADAGAQPLTPGSLSLQHRQVLDALRRTAPAHNTADTFRSVPLTPAPPAKARGNCDTHARQAGTTLMSVERREALCATPSKPQ